MSADEFSNMSEAELEAAARKLATEISQRQANDFARYLLDTHKAGLGQALFLALQEADDPKHGSLVIAANGSFAPHDIAALKAAFDRFLQDVQAGAVHYPEQKICQLPGLTMNEKGELRADE